MNDPVNPNEYKPEEDPSLFDSAHNPHRTPLSANWISSLKTSAQTPSTNKRIFMCCYKLCRIECAFWGCQSRVEKSIADSVLRNMLLVTHRQAWTWQDEYNKLTMDDVRKLEAETQRYLLTKMKEDPGVESCDDSAINTNSQSRSRSNSSHLITIEDSSNMLTIERLEIDGGCVASSVTVEDFKGMKKMDSENSMKSCVSSGSASKKNSELEFNLQMLDTDATDLLSQNSNNFEVNKFTLF